MTIQELLDEVPKKFIDDDVRTREKQVRAKFDLAAIITITGDRVREDRDVRAFIEGIGDEIQALQTYGYAMIERATRMAELHTELERILREKS